MSIASEITRLQGVKSDILQAIRNKGVFVPVGSALDDCPDLIGNIAGLAGADENYVDYDSKYPWFYTPNFNLTDARIIEENIVCKATSFATGLSYHQCGGQWYTGTSSYFNGVAVYISENQVEFDYATATYEYEATAYYDFSKWIRKNIIYDKDSGVTTCKIYYDDVLICTHLINTSNILFANNIPYCIGGTRFNSRTTNTFKGLIDFKKSNIRIDGITIWGGA